MFANNTDYRVDAKKQKTGCHLSIVCGFALTILVMILVMGVGVVVHYASPPKSVECQCEFPGYNDASDQRSSMEFCEKLATEGNAEICE